MNTPIYEFDASRSKTHYAWRDLRIAASNPNLIVMLVANDVTNRFRGTVLGGFWITLTTLATASGLALLYGKIFGADLKTYYPYVAIGIIIWGLISSLINDGVSAFTSGSAIFNQTPLPKSLLIFKAIGKSLWALGFKVIVLVGVLIFSGTNPGITGIVTALCGLALTVWTGFFFALAFATLGARFRDLGQLVDVGLTFSFFATPVFWHSDRLGEYAQYITLNPFYHFLHIVRGPLIGAADIGESFIWASVIAGLVTLFGLMVFGQFARRIPYWC